MCTSRDIFQSKVDKLLDDTKGIKTYIDDILVLIKDLFSKYTEKMRIIFGRLRAAGFKVNVFK